MQDYREVERITQRYVLYCQARISRLISISNDELSVMGKMVDSFSGKAFVAEIDIYRSQIISLYFEGQKRCKPFRSVLNGMERYRADLLSSLGVLDNDVYGQPIYNSSVFIPNDCEKLRVVILYCAHRLLVAHLIRMKSVYETRTLTMGIDGSSSAPVPHVLYSGGEHWQRPLPNDLAAGFNSYPSGT